jgi:hypothetical protein
MNHQYSALCFILLGLVSAPGSARAQEKDFVPLFNGKDLTGWKLHPDAQGNWRVENGILIGTGPKFSHLFTEKSDWKDIHVRVETRVSTPGNSGVHIRAPFIAQIGSIGYEAQIDNAGAWKTGTLFIRGGSPIVLVKEQHVKPNDWFVMDHIVYDNHIIIKVNGTTVVKYTDPTRAFARGHIALQQHNPKTTVEFKSILVKELKGPPSEVELPRPTGPLADRIEVKTVELAEGVKYAYRGGRPNRSNLVLAPSKDGYRLGWTDTKGNAHVTPLTPDFKLAGNDLVLANLDLRGLVVHDDGAVGVMAAELPLKMCVLRLSPAGQEEFRTVLTGAKGTALKERYLDNLWCFSGQLAASANQYAAHFAHVWQTDPNVAHQGGYYGQVDFQGKVVKENGWTVSHSLDQRVLHHQNAFVTLSLGDTFPRGIYFENRTTGKNLLSYPPEGQKATFDPRGAMQLGSLVPAGDNVAAAFVTQHGETKVLTYQLLSLDAKLLTSVKVSELPKTAPHVVRLAPYGGNLLLARQDGQESSKLVVFDHQGRILDQPTTVPEPLPDNDELVALPGGDVGWVLATHGERTVRLIRVKK